MKKVYLWEINPHGIQVRSRLYLFESTYPLSEACSFKPGLDIFPFSASQYTSLFRFLANLSLQRLYLHFTCTFNSVKQPWWAVNTRQNCTINSIAVTPFCSPETWHVGRHSYPHTNNRLNSSITDLNWVREEAIGFLHNSLSAVLSEESVESLIRWLIGQQLKNKPRPHYLQYFTVYQTQSYLIWH